MLQSPLSRLKNNNFDLLRLLFAVTVCLFHIDKISGFPQLGWISTVCSADLAVKAFFVVSGFLIFMSFERSSSLRSYLNKRLRRIYPAYCTVIVLCAIGLISVSSAPAEVYFSSAFSKYLAANLSFLNFLQPTLPGVFSSHIFTAVNGALWTLKVEVLFYLSVPLLVLLIRRIGCLQILTLVYCASVLYRWLAIEMAEDTGSALFIELSRQLPGQMSYFIAGAFFYYFLSSFERRVGFFLAFAVPVLIVHRIYPLPLLEPLALATLVVFFGLFLYAGNFGKYGDISYGVYILHFPIIQLFLHAGWFSKTPWLFLAAVILTTTLAAIALWHLVEKRFLLGSSHYIAAIR